MLLWKQQAYYLLNEVVIEKTIAIRQTKKIGLGDAIIAATALEHEMTLVTRNLADFKNIQGLKLIDPYEL
jgi:toxin FitB